MNKFLVFSCVAAAVMFSGCATIMTGSKQDITVTSYPEGAKVKINGAEVCGATPCKVSLDRAKTAAVVSVEKSGYKTLTREIPSDMNSWVLGNIIFGGVLGTTTDAMSGSLYKYSDNSVHVELKKD